ncbi:MAG: tRNA (N(6)-L-threonylcarbamoyladenosine(37)-C(2))-methylthiotransferase MtaB, partial [Lachnospiraceae bacterium]|nr:tRNA (N(6)-L-threonylcarbamoyladenosine(37)-C(2))-methylthiotransferase MtaB [Candidatus Equihabitans merdae]
MKAAFHNLGCKVNEYETEAMKQQLMAAGYEIVPFGEAADVYVINTCTVTQMADRKSRQMLHKAHQMNPDAIVVAAGCYVQEDRERVLADDAVNIVVGHQEKARLAELIETYQKSGSTEGNFAADIKEAKVYQNLKLDKPVDRTRAFVKIQDGCNQYCTYCLIPFARGRVRSRQAEDVVAEVKRFAENGIKEIVLTGIHISSYGLDFAGGPVSTPMADKAVTNQALLDLIGQLHAIEGIRRIRLGSLEPGIVTSEFAEAIGKMDKICPEFHLSLQSGCDATLERMNRRYRAEDYRKAVRRLRLAFDRPAITTDVIVGFPGETEEEFEESRAFVDEIDFAKTHIFKYSRRKKTKAYDMPDQVQEREKTRRSSILLELDQKKIQAYADSISAKEWEVLFEESRDVGGLTYWRGHTRENLNVMMASEQNLENEILLCRYL